MRLPGCGCGICTTSLSSCTLPGRIKYFCRFAVRLTTLLKAKTLKPRILHILPLALLLLLGCSRTKDTFTSRVYHQVLSQFNPLFNGEQALLTGEEMMRQQQVDNYDEILSVFRYGDESTASTIKPDMDRAIEKATKVIREHSMMIRDDQKNDYIDDAYMLIGKARFYKREYIEALETFNYVVQEFPHSEINDQALLWAAKTETEMGNYLSAKTKFEKIYRSEDFNRSEQALAFASYAQLHIDQGNKTAAYQLLQQAVEKTKDKELEVRWLFIMGQLQSALGNNFEASELFRRVIRKGPPYDLLFNAQLKRARNYDTDLQDPEDVLDDLRDMLADGKNVDNRDQIYYVMAEVAEKMGDEAAMEEYLKKSIRVSTYNSNQKALSYLKLGETNFDNKLYPTAAAYYDSAFGAIDNKHARFEEIQKKKESLQGLVDNLRIIETQDSLQALSSLTEKQLQQRLQAMKEREKREEESAMDDPFFNQGNSGGSVAQNAQGAVQGGKWYFYNVNLRASGLRDFTNRWGNRKLEDNWRRKDKLSEAGFDSGEELAETEGEADGGQSGEETAVAGSQEEIVKYFGKIPHTPTEMAESDRKIQNAYMAISVIYKDQLKDPDAAERELEDLLKRYPDMEERGRVWYMLYRINVATEDTKGAEHYKNLILQNYPHSEYAALVNGKNLEEKGSSESKTYYTKTYRRYSKGDYRKSLNMADSGLTAYAGTPHGPQFMMLKAFSYGKLGNSSRMEETLNSLVTQYPGTEQSKEAQRVLSYMNPPEPEGGEQASTGESSSAPVEEGKYKSADREEHKYIVVVPNKKGLVNNMSIALTDFNTKFFKNLNLRTKMIYISPEEQMVLVSGLPNKQKAIQYMSILGQQDLLEKNLGSKEDVKHFVISNTNFTTFYRDKDFKGYQSYFQNNYR